MDRYQKILIWILSYVPLYFLCFLRYFDREIFNKLEELSNWSNIYIIITVLIVSMILFLIFKKIGEWYLLVIINHISKEKDNGQIDEYEIRKIKKINLSYLNTFLLSIFLPIIAFDMAHEMDIVLFIIITFILVLASSQMLIISPLFFFSKHLEIFEAELSLDSKENEVEGSRFRTIIVVKSGDLSLNKPMKGFQIEEKEFIYLKN